MADFAVVVHVDADIVVEAGVVVQHQPARSAGGDEACITLDLIGIQREVGGEHHINIMAVDGVQQGRSEFRGLQEIIILLERGFLIRVEQRVTDEEKAQPVGFLA